MTRFALEVSQYTPVVCLVFRNEESLYGYALTAPSLEAKYEPAEEDGHPPVAVFIRTGYRL
jgi:hypothetical protein